MTALYIDNQIKDDRARAAAGSTRLHQRAVAALATRRGRLDELIAISKSGKRGATQHAQPDAIPDASRSFDTSHLEHRTV
jgi:hypothetical protein